MQPSTRLYLEPDESHRYTAHSFKIHYNAFLLRPVVAVNSEGKTLRFTTTQFLQIYLTCVLHVPSIRYIKTYAYNAILLS
jgi:hypothetical protein